MIHPSYVELMKVVNNNVEFGEEPVVNSRYSLVIAAANGRQDHMSKAIVHRCRRTLRGQSKDHSRHRR